MLEALAALGAVAALAVAARPRARAVVAPAVLCASGLSAAASIVALLGPGRTSGWLSLVESAALIALVFFALRRAPRRLGAVAACLAGATTVLIIPAHETASDSLLVNAAGMAVWGLVALVAAGAARYLEALDARRARSVAEARQEQRLALARDLHDFVSHDVSAMVVQAQAARVVGVEQPQEALAALQRIEQAGLHALSAMDRAVDALRDAGPPAGVPAGGEVESTPPHRRHGIEDLRALTARFAATGAVRVELDLGDDVAEGVPAEVGSVVYRLVTEALTNVRRHAPGATCVEVVIVRAGHGDARAIAVSVTDDGVCGHTAVSALDARDRSGGSGLVGLRERVEALGGTLHAGPHEPDGWQVSATLPLGDRAAFTVRGAEAW